MLKVIRSNKKFVLAGLMILSMLTFVVNRGNGNGGNSTDRELGTIGTQTVYTSEIAEAKAEANALRTNLPALMEDRFLAELISKPEKFFLLRHEARQLNIEANNDDVMALLTREAPELKPDNDSYELTRQAITDLFRIMNRVSQASSVIKASKPLVDRALVAERETMQANIVQLPASDYTSKVPAPTTQAMTDQFNQFADSPPGHPVPTTNPFGFGYKLPARAKVEYLRLTPQAAANSVIATKSNYDWEVAANKYYLVNSSEFIPKPATTAPVTAPQVAPPFVVVHDQVLQKIRQPLVASLMDQVQSFVNTTLSQDYQNYSRSFAGGSTSPEPDSSLGVKFSSFTYLSKLIEKVQGKFNVLLLAGESPDYLSNQQIGAIPGVGNTALADYIDKQMTNYLAYVDQKNPLANAILFRPSPPLVETENESSVVFARMIAALPAQKPESLDLVQSQVKADLIAAQAYKLALADAALQLAAAKFGTLLALAHATGHTVLALDSESAITTSSNEVKGLFPPLGNAAPSFMDQAFKALDSYDPKTNPHPAQIVELPEQQRVFVVQVTFLNAAWNAENYTGSLFDAQRNAVTLQKQAFFRDWFDYDMICKRLNYQVGKKS